MTPLFSFLLPSKLENDPGCDLKDGVLKATQKLDKDEEKRILEKLAAYKDEVGASAKKPPKHVRAEQRRLEFVVSFHSEDSSKSASLHDRSYLSAMQQTVDLSLDDTYVSFGANADAGKLASAKSSALVLSDRQRRTIDASVAGDKKLEIKPKLGRKALKKAKKAEREKTKGDAWFGMPATEMTDEIKNDLEVLQMRGALDPKRFYKKNDMKVLPKYFQMGHYVDSPAEFYSDRTTKKAKKKTFVDELMADAEFKKYNKRKFAEIIDEKVKHMSRRDRGKFMKHKKRKTAALQD